MSHHHVPHCIDNTISTSIGYQELKTHRSHLVDMPTHLGLAHVPLDGVGCTFTLVKAHVHREGVMFPTYTFDNQVSSSSFSRVKGR
jgi:hypothetical protein